MVTELCNSYRFYLALMIAYAGINRLPKTFYRLSALHERLPRSASRISDRSKAGLVVRETEACAEKT